MLSPKLTLVILSLVLMAVPALGSEMEDFDADFGEEVRMRNFHRFATPTETMEPSVTIPQSPTGFDEVICSAYPEICINAGLLPKPFPQ